jgi:hypothetical protein
VLHRTDASFTGGDFSVTDSVINRTGMIELQIIAVSGSFQFRRWSGLFGRARADASLGRVPSIIPALRGALVLLMAGATSTHSAFGQTAAGPDFGPPVELHQPAELHQADAPPQLPSLPLPAPLPELPTDSVPLQPAPIVTGPAVPLPIPSTPATSGPASLATPICAEEFWVASSRKCRQTEPHGCACGDLDFYHVAAGCPTQTFNRDSFYASLAPGVPVCVVVHGSFIQWRGLCDECWPVYHWIRGAAPARPVQVIFYTWPSEGGITYEPHIDVAVLGKRATFNSIYLGDLIARIPPGHPVCVIGHSHGARMVAAALHLLAGGEVENGRLTYLPPPDQRIRSVLIAGALDHNWLNPGERYGMALCRTECVLVFRNDHDIVLSLYPLRYPFSRRALGEKGIGKHDLRRLGPLSEKIRVIDVTRIVHVGHMWNNYYRRPELAAAIVPYVYYEDMSPIPAWPLQPTAGKARPRFLAAD